MLRFYSEESLYNWIDKTLKTWVNDQANKYTTFKEMGNNIKDVFPNIKEKNQALKCLRSFTIVALHSAYIKGILDAGMLYMTHNGKDIVTVINNIYDTVIRGRFEDNIEIYRKIWDEKHTNHETNKYIFSNSVTKKSLFACYDTDFESDIISYLGKIFSNLIMFDYEKLNEDSDYSINFLKYDHKKGYFENDKKGIIWKKLDLCITNNTPFGISYHEYYHTNNKYNIDNVLFFFINIAYKMFFDPAIKYLIGLDRQWKSKDFTRELIKLTDIFYKSFRNMRVVLESKKKIRL